jgi:hypothetical protein
MGAEGVRELLHRRGREANRLRAWSGLEEGPGQDDLVLEGAGADDEV